MNHPNDKSDLLLTRIVTALAAIIALALTVALPTAYLLSAYSSRQAEIAAEAKLGAAVISQLASSNPDLWVFENSRIHGLLTMLGPASEPERRIVVANTERNVVEQGDELPPPLTIAASPVYDSGIAVGRVEIQRSLRKMLVTTAVTALLAGSLGTISFMVLRSWPLKLLRRALAQSTHLATHDSLTGLPNRMLFQDRLDQSLAWCRRENQALAVLYLDLDRFKEVNDTLGHAAGDQLLIAVANRLRKSVRETDTLARLGGDEFAVLQVGMRQLADTDLLARHLIDVLHQEFILDGSQVAVGVSIGIALRNARDPTPDAGTLLQEADIALYRAKGEGRGVHRFFAAEMNRTLLERRSLETDIVRALEQGQFSLHYQPQFELIGRQLVGAEALLRWHHPLRGEVPPAAFVPLAEDTGLIWRIGEWVLQEACRQAALWPGLHCVAVNVSPIQFRRPGFLDQVTRALRQAGLEPARLEIEITEGVLLHETEDTLATLRRLRRLGVAIAMDDFGTGYSSLGYLQKFRFDKIKIDRSFVSGLATDAHAAEIVRAVLRMSHAMGIRVNAEGVEYEQQASMLLEEGCEEVQGFLFSRALPVAEFSKLLACHAHQGPTREAAAV